MLAPGTSAQTGHLTFEDIYLSYGKTAPLNGLSLDVYAGEVLCLLGPSGSGKTSLLRVAAGLERPSAGRVVLDDDELTGKQTFKAPELRSVGLMFQDYALFPHMSVLDNVSFGLNDIARDARRIEALEALDRVGMAHYAASFPHTLSGGEQQRVALARALAPCPSVILMDEPFSGLDTRLRDDVRAQTLQILRESAMTTILVTHDPEEAMRVGDRIALLNGGKICQVGSPRELFYEPDNLFVAGYFSELNTFDSVANDKCVETPFGTVQCGQFVDGTPVTVAFRPDCVSVETYRNVSNTIKMQVIERRFLGITEMFQLSIAGLEKPILARIRSGVVPEDVNHLSIFIAPKDIMVFESRD
ncbi:MAG: ABC transporter ATP-binding protein [Pseudomonadota bacterium]